MMRFQQATAAALAALFVLPAAGKLGESLGFDLEQDIEQTARALHEMLGLEARLRSGDRAAVPEVLTRTEPGLADPARCDEMMVTLRADLGRLQGELDEVSTKPRHSTPIVVEEGALAPQPAPTAGTTPPTTSGADATRQFEKDPGYSADVVRSVQLLLRADRPVEAIAALEPLHADPETNTPEVRYWWARSHERASLFGPALEAYDGLVDDPGAGRFAERSRLDREFLRVKLQLAGGEQGKKEDGE